MRKTKLVDDNTLTAVIDYDYVIGFEYGKTKAMVLSSHYLATQDTPLSSLVS